MHLVQDALVIGIRVNRIHQAPLDPKVVVEYLGGWRETVGGA